MGKVRWSLACFAAFDSWLEKDKVKGPESISAGRKAGVKGEVSAVSCQ